MEMSKPENSIERQIIALVIPVILDELTHGDTIIEPSDQLSEQLIKLAKSILAIPEIAEALEDEARMEQGA